MRFLRLFFAFAAVLPVLAILPAAHAQPPETVLIQGQLLDDQGAPIVGLRQYRVRFFDAEVDGAQLGGDFVDFTQVNAQGLFAIALIPPAAVLSTPDAWYELALDSGTPPVGVGPEDVFPGRVRVHSVPFARVAGEALRVEVEAIGGGAVSAAEFESLAGITGSVQSQLDTKAEASAVDDALALKADAADVYTRAEVDDAFAQVPDLADVLTRTGESFVVVETTDDPVQNGVNLLAAYAEASALEPYGQQLGAANRAVVLLPPGKYDLGSAQLELNTPFVDIEGISSDRDKQHIFGTANGPGTGVLRQTASNVRIENLFVECTRDSGGLNLSADDPAAYFPDSNLPGTIMRNCRFESASDAHSMRIRITYSGTYENSIGRFLAFGGGVGGVASGTFINCAGFTGAFGGSGGTASGTFTNCVGELASFGGEGTASGVFTHCIGGQSAFGGFGGTASGTFTYCVGGNSAFGGSGSAPGGAFYYCVGGPFSFTSTGNPTVVFCVQDGEPYEP